MSTSNTSKRKVKNTILRAEANVNKLWYLVNEMLKASSSGKQGINILFSIKPGWEKNIRLGFRATKHQLTFGEFNEESIANNDLVVPLTIKDIFYLNEHRCLIQNNTIPIPEISAVNICNDKYLFYQTLTKNGFGQYLPKISANLPFPYILKKKVAEDSEACFIIDSISLENEHSSLISSSDYFCQEMVRGPKEFATHLLLKNEKIVSSINIEYFFQKEIPIKGKDRILYKKLCPCPYLDLFSDILKSIGFEGLCCFNYKIYDGQLYIFELNPRFGGSLCTFFFSFINNII